MIVMVSDRVRANNMFKERLNKLMDNQVQKQVLKGICVDTSSCLSSTDCEW